MYYEEDWLMRQIQLSILFLAKLLFNKDMVFYELPQYEPGCDDALSELDRLYLQLLNLLEQHELCAAEDLLFEQYQAESREHLYLALDFYQRLDQLDDKTLEAHNFPREEIMAGLRDILCRSGVDPALAGL